MYRVPELMLKDGQPDIDFFFSWANEPWNRRWTGGNDPDDILLTQDYGDTEEWTDHFDYLLPFFQLERYTKIDGRPVFVIYRIGHAAAHLQAMLSLWNTRAYENGFAGMYFISTIGNFYLQDTQTQQLLKKTEELQAAFHFHPQIVATFPKQIMFSKSNVPGFQKTQYWGFCVGKHIDGSSYPIPPIYPLYPFTL